MIKTLDFPIIGDSKNVPQDDAEYTLNYYGEKVSEEIWTAKPTPGSVRHSQMNGFAGGRGEIVAGGRLFGVRGFNLQEYINGAWFTYPNAVLQTNTGKVTIIACEPAVESGTTRAAILIVDDVAGYAFRLDDNFFKQLGPADNFLGGGSQAAFCAGRAFVMVPGTTQFQCSNLFDFFTWRTDATGACNSLSTALKALASNGDLLYAWSDGGFELYQANNNPIFPVQRILSGDRIGIKAPQSALFSERYVYWLGGTAEGSGVIYRHSGGSKPERISSHSIERHIAALSNPSEAIGLTYQRLGHVFYLLTFQNGNKTFCIDMTTGLWHERAIRDASTGQLSAWPMVTLAEFAGQLLGMDYRDGSVFSIEDGVGSDDGAPIRRERIMSPIPPEADNLTYFQSVELFAEYGNAPIGQPDPQYMFRYSADRGKTWSSELWQVAGGNNTYAGRLRWVGLGSAYSLVPWFAVVTSQYISLRSVRVRAE